VTAPREVRAAGCVVWRRGKREPEVLLVHRPRWSDWSFPKGKVDPGETLVAAAVREVREETGLQVRLGPRLPDQEYLLDGGQRKRVSYWTAKAPKRGDISGYRPNDEVDDLGWVPLRKARRQLTYSRDADLLDQFDGSGFESSPLVVVRHAKAVPRSRWTGADVDRPLDPAGEEQARRLVADLSAYGVTRVLSSDAVRCADTVRPYVEATGTGLVLTRHLSEADHTAKGLAKVVGEALARPTRIALCSHRPVLPDIFATLGVADVGLPTGGVLVVHRLEGTVVDVEQHGFDRDPT